jgi:hypothetical protein
VVVVAVVVAAVVVCLLIVAEVVVSFDYLLVDLKAVVVEADQRRMDFILVKFRFLVIFFINYKIYFC